MKTASKPSDFLTVKEMARALQDSEKSLKRFIAEGTVRAVDLSPRITRIHRSELDRLIPKQVMEKLIQKLADGSNGCAGGCAVNGSHKKTAEIKR